MFIFAFVLAVLIAAKDAGCTDGAGGLLMTEFCLYIIPCSLMIWVSFWGYVTKVLMVDLEQ